jgi:hypothetical protein
MQTVKALVEQATNPLWIEPEASVLHNVWSNLEFLGIFDEDDHPRYEEIVEKAAARLTSMGLCVTIDE